MANRTKFTTNPQGAKHCRRARRSRPTGNLGRLNRSAKWQYASSYAEARAIAVRCADHVQHTEVR